MNLYEILQNSDRVGEGMTHFERLFAQKIGGGSTVITGVPPLRYIGDGRPLTNYRIAGNTVQDGTPSPDAPVDATGCGVRTGNLLDKSTTRNGYYIDDADGEMKYNAGYVGILSASDFIYIGGASSVYIREQSGHRWGAFYDSEKVFVSGFNGYGDKIVPNNAAYVRITVNNDILDSMMLNLGSTALSYEPYGFKLPLTVNGTEYPIYLGQVETTRRVKKLVLTGEEHWSYNATYNTFSLALSDLKTSGLRKTTLYCSHYMTIDDGRPISNVPNNSIYTDQVISIYIMTDAYTTTTNFKSYLSAQYAAGTPVTIWYVLAEPETGIVNEPLMKIGDYADTVSAAQAGVTIPTVSGANVLDVPTTVPPSEVWIRGRVKEV